MASTYTTSLRIEKPGTGEQSGTWGTTVNTSYDLMEKAVAGYLSIAMGDANVTLTTANGSSDQARNAVIELTGTNTATRQCIVPAVSKVYVIKNSTTQSVTVKTSGGTGPTILSGKASVVYCDGTNVNSVAVSETTGLAALSGVTPATDTLPYFTSSSAATVTSLTSFARTILDDADAATARATLGVTIGTNVQAYSAVLGTLSTVSPAADALPYFTGTSTASVTTLTAFARTLLDDPDAATARATLGVTAGGTALQAANNLSDVSSVSTSRTNLGLGTAATQNTGTSGANVPLLNGANTWSARQDIGSGVASGSICFSLQNSTVTNNSIAFYFQGSGTAGTFLPIDGGVNSTGDEFGYDFTNNYWFFDAAPRVSGSPMVTTTSTDTLSNKTISSPTISGTITSSGTLNQSGQARFTANNPTSFDRPSASSFSQYLIELRYDATTAGYIGATSTNAFMASNTGGTVLLASNNSNGNLTVFGAITSGGVAVPTISSTDILTNKTLSSPTISGTVAGSPTATGAWTFSGSLITILRSGTAPTAAGDESLRVISTGGTNFNTAIGIVSGNAAEARILFGDSDDVDIGFITYLHTNNSLIIGTNNANAAIFSNTGALSVTGSITSAGTAVPTISSTDTLSNKTLSSPTLSGTVAGTPTFSGVVGFDGSVSIKNGSGTIKGYIGIGTQVDGGSGTDAVLRGEDGISFSIAGSRYARLTSSNFNSVVGITVNSVSVPTISSTDTLSNKTLSSPTISGTVAGTPTFSGATTFSATGAAITINNAEPRMDFYQTDAGADAKRWAFIADGNNFYLQTRTDADAFGANVISIVRSGTTGSSVSVTASSLNFTGVSTFQQTTDTIVTSQGGAGYGAFYSRGSGTNSSYVFFGNSTNNERSRILVDNSRNFIISNNDGSTNHFQVGPTGALTASGVAIPTVSSTDTLSNKTLTSPTINGGTIQSRVQTSSETSGTLTSASANKHLALTGNITLNNSVFTADDKMTLDPGTSARTITRGAGCTMYVNGVDSATATIAANQMAGVHVRSASVFVLTGAVS